MNVLVNNPSDLQKAAETFLHQYPDARVVAFHGSMGAGKTTLIKAICQQLGVIDVVNSPTFALVNEYTCPNGQSVYHFDFYRINKLEEVYDMGYEEYIESGQYCFMEWPERIESLLPDNCIHIHIEETNNNQRIIRSID